VKELGVTNGLEILDLGCGDGTTAVPAAQLGANVLGVDIARNLVDAGNRRAERLGLGTVAFRKAMRPTCVTSTMPASTWW
jgi:2-polyprenyl-3-methyl-5-hydroxy-6-metoxy-1,4-benzoquinol methylase